VEGNGRVTRESSVVPKPRISELVTAQRAALQQVLSDDKEVDRFIRNALALLRITPELESCTPDSVWGSLMLAAHLGLDVSPTLGHVYIVPRTQGGVRKAHFILGWRGMVDLAYRSGAVASINAEVVREGDRFEVIGGSGLHIVHRPKLTDSKRDVIASYAIAQTTTGGIVASVCDRWEIEQHRMRSAMPDKGPWATDYAAMARKTAIRSLWYKLPLQGSLAALDREGVGENSRPGRGDHRP
jgi:recombination protein RecT